MAEAAFLIGGWTSPAGLIKITVTTPRCWVVGKFLPHFPTCSGEAFFLFGQHRDRPLAIVGGRSRLFYSGLAGGSSPVHAGRQSGQTPR